MEFRATTQIVEPTPVPPVVVPAYEISFDNRYMLTGFVNASLMPGTPFVNMWGNVTVDNLLSTNKKGVITRIDRRLQSANQDNIAIAYDLATLNSVMSLLRICRYPSISHYYAFLAESDELYPCHLISYDLNQWVSQPISIDLDHTIFTTQYATWNTHQLEYQGHDTPQNGDVWSGGLVLGASGATINLGDYLTKDVMFGNNDPFRPTYLEKIKVSFSVPGYQYLRAAGYTTPFVRADLPYVLEWLSDSTDVVLTELYCRDLCCCDCDGIYYGSFAPSGSLQVDGHSVGTQRLWLIKGINSSGLAITQMWFTAVAVCPRRVTYFGELIQDCKIYPSPEPPVPTPSVLPPPPSLSPSQSILSTSPSASTSQSILSPSPSPSPSISLSPSPSESPSLSVSREPSLSHSPSLSPSPSPSAERISHLDFYPRVSDTIDGRFVITWQRMIADRLSRDNYIVMAQVFASDGSAVTAEFIVPSYYDPEAGDYIGYTPDVAMAPDGTFVVTWEGPDIDYGSGIKARVFNADGTPSANQFRVNLLRPSTYFTPAIGMRSDKSFIIIWKEIDEHLVQSISGQRFSPYVVKVGEPNFQISVPPVPHNVDNPDIDVADDGNMVAVWSINMGGITGDWPHVLAQRLDLDGAKIGVAFQVDTTNNTMINVSMCPRVSLSPAGAFVVTWQTYPEPQTIVLNRHGDAAYIGFDIYARQYNAAGSPLTVNDFRVNTYQASYQINPDVACDADGNFVIVWETYGQDDPLTDDYGIFGRLYQANGIPVGDEFCINNPDLAGRAIGHQGWPGIEDGVSAQGVGGVAVTRKASDGQYVVAWQGQRGNAPIGGIYGIWWSQWPGLPAI